MNKRKKNHRRNGQKQLIIMVVVLLLMMISLAAAFVFLYKPSTAGHGELPFSTDVRPDTGDPSDTRMPVSGTSAPDTTDSGTSSGTVYTHREEVYNFLIVGHDRAATLADVIMLVNYDVKAGRIAIMQLPRDTYFEGDTNKASLNVQFSAYYNRAVLAGDKNPAATAAEKFSAALQKALCIKIHYTAVMNLDGFAGIVNAIGGVDIDIPYDMDYEDPEQDLYIHFKKGPTHLNGEQAEGFVRYRKGFVQADIGRGNAQKLFLTAFIEKAKSSLSVSNIPVLTTLANQVISNLTTNISAPDIVYFAKNALAVDFSKIVMMTVPGDGVYASYVINRADTLKVINEYFNVYDNDITDAIFDPERVFTDDSPSAIASAYYAESAALINEYTAEEIQRDSINIPLNPGEN